MPLGRQTLFARMAGNSVPPQAKTKQEGLAATSTQSFGGSSIRTAAESRMQQTSKVTTMVQSATVLSSPFKTATIKGVVSGGLFSF